MGGLLADVGIWSTPAARAMLLVHLLLAVFALGVVTHHWWLAISRNPAPARLAKYAWWMAIGYPLSWLFGVVIYPSYNVWIRKGPTTPGGLGGHGWLEDHVRWAVGLFEIKEHLGTIALVMLPWLVLSAYRLDRLSRAERISYLAATWVFTIFIYYSFIAGGIVTSVRSF